MLTRCAPTPPPHPRPHNSGHYTMEACETDQFENHLRAILGMPLGSTSLKVGAAVMLNVLGEGSMEDTKALMKRALAVPGAGLHWYGKAEAKKGERWGRGVSSSWCLGSITWMVVGHTRRKADHVGTTLKMAAMYDIMLYQSLLLVPTDACVVWVGRAQDGAHHLHGLLAAPAQGARRRL
jgi:hypothetical protein